MTLNLDLSGITARLRVTGYYPSAQDDWTGEWCKTDFSFHAAPWLDYRQEADEVFLCREIEDLYTVLEKFLRDELTEPREFPLMEPDFTFRLYPKEDLRENPRVTYIHPAADPIADIRAEWTVSFWQDGLTGNFLSLALDRRDIGYLRSYFGLLTGRVAEDAPEVKGMMENGILEAD